MAIGNPCAGQIHACMIRVARLDTDGSVLVGATSAVVTSGVIKLGFDPEYAEGEAYESENGCGTTCVTFRDPDRLLRVNLELEACVPDPYLHELLAGGELLQDSPTDPVGYALPSTSAETDAVSVELWSKRITDGSPDPDHPWNRWVFPKTFWRVGSREHAKGVYTSTFSGYGIENSGWGAGPDADWARTSSRVGQFYPVDSIPTESCGYVAVA